jgi:hypothetical protein
MRWDYHELLMRSTNLLGKKFYDELKERVEQAEHERANSPKD